MQSVQCRSWDPCFLSDAISFWVKENRVIVGESCEIPWDSLLVCIALKSFRSFPQLCYCCVIREPSSAEIVIVPAILDSNSNIFKVTATGFLWSVCSEVSPWSKLFQCVKLMPYAKSAGKRDRSSASMPPNPSPWSLYRQRKTKRCNRMQPKAWSKHFTSLLTGVGRSSWRKNVSDNSAY